MEDILKDIFPNEEGAIDRDTLLKYLKGDLPPDEMHRIEALLLDSDMLNDAVEGLQGAVSGKQLEVIEKELSTRLKNQLKKNKERRLRKEIKELPWIYILIVIILLLIIISFAVVKSFL